MKQVLKNELLQKLSDPELKQNKTAGKRDFLQDNKICEMIIEKVEDLLVNI